MSVLAIERDRGFRYSRPSGASIACCYAFCSIEGWMYGRYKGRREARCDGLPASKVIFGNGRPGRPTSTDPGQVIREDIVDGLEQSPEAFIGLLAVRTSGS